MSSPASDNLEQLDLFQPQEYTLGLDLGIKSIGWAVLHGERITRAGVYLFETAEEISNKKLVSKTAEQICLKLGILVLWIDFYQVC